MSVRKRLLVLRTRPIATLSTTRADKNQIRRGGREVGFGVIAMSLSHAKPFVGDNPTDSKSLLRKGHASRAYLQPFLLSLSANQLTTIMEIFPYTSEKKSCKYALVRTLALGGEICADK